MKKFVSLVIALMLCLSAALADGSVATLEIEEESVCIEEIVGTEVFLTVEDIKGVFTVTTDKAKEWLNNGCTDVTFTCGGVSTKLGIRQLAVNAAKYVITLDTVPEVSDGESLRTGIATMLYRVDYKAVMEDGTEKDVARKLKGKLTLSCPVDGVTDSMRAITVGKNGWQRTKVAHTRRTADGIFYVTTETLYSALYMTCREPHPAGDFDLLVTGWPDDGEELVEEIIQMKIYVVDIAKGGSVKITIKVNDRVVETIKDVKGDADGMYILDYILEILPEDLMSDDFTVTVTATDGATTKKAVRHYEIAFD